MIQCDVANGFAEVTIRHRKPLNPISMEMTRRLTELARSLGADDEVRGVLLWGGEGRSFSVGGDFEDVSRLTEEAAVHTYAHEILASYKALLRVGKPLVVAIDHYVIGLGLQVALMSDWIVASERATFHMPELAGGLACPMGSAILEHLIGRASMLELVNGCEGIGADRARALGLAHDVVPHQSLRTQAISRLEKFASFPALPYRLTKELHNQRFERILAELEEPAARIHWACFQARQAQDHFERVLGNPS